MRKKLSRRAFVKVARNALKANRDARLVGKRRRAVACYALVLSRPILLRAMMHLRLVLLHKTYVFLYCAYAGIPFRGFMHDWSKFSMTEFWPSVKYFSGRGSPVGLCREMEGYSPGWVHHKGRNMHHHEYWVDVVDEKGVTVKTPYTIVPIPMPYPYALEMICDTIAASRAYNGRGFSYQKLFQWWKHYNRLPVNMHPKTKRFAQMIYEELERVGSRKALKSARLLYEKAYRADENAADSETHRA